MVWEPGNGDNVIGSTGGGNNGVLFVYGCWFLMEVTTMDIIYESILKNRI